MGGRLGRNRAADDPFYNPVPPPGASQIGYDPTGGLGAYGPYEEYDPYLSMGNYYGEPIKRRPTAYAGRYAQGLNQMGSTSPWNYGNYYLGNTTMQMMPMMLNKVHKYGQIQAMSALGNAGLLGPGFRNTGLLGSGLGNFGLSGSAMVMPCCPAPSFSMPAAAPMISCCPQSSFNFSAAAPMMAAATPLPVAFNPLVQGMYPIATLNPVNWMSPSSFMSALTSGPMPYRPPAYQFPSNVGAVMTIPYGTPNPLLASPSFGGFDSSKNFGNGSFPNSFSFSTPAPAVPASSAVSYYPQPYPVSVPNVQQVPVQRNVSTIAPPIISSSNHPLPVSARVPLWPSQGTFSDNISGRPTVFASNNNSATNVAATTNRVTSGSLPVYEPTDKSNLLIGQPVMSSLSNSVSNTSNHLVVTPSISKSNKSFKQSYDKLSARIRHHIPSISNLSRSNYSLNTYQTRKDPVLPPILCGELISDSGWLPKTANLPSIPSILPSKKSKRSVFSTNNTGQSIIYSNSSLPSLFKRRRRHRSNSSASEYDCAICRQERDKRRLREYYGSSTLSSLLSSSSPKKHSRRHHLSTNESFLSSKGYSSVSHKRDNYKSHRRHPTKIKIKSKTPSSSGKSNSPILLRKVPIEDQESNKIVVDEKETDDDDDEEEDQTPDKENNSRTGKKSSDDNDSIAD